MPALDTASLSPSSTLAALRRPRLLTREALAGLVVALALIPEAISFSIIATPHLQPECPRPTYMADASGAVQGRWSIC